MPEQTLPQSVASEADLAEVSVEPIESKPMPAPKPTASEPPLEKDTSVIIPKAVSSQPVPEDAKLKHPSLYFNQELGWIDFNWRVLYQALDERTPLLERVRFVAITASNLDEFVQKRVGGLKRQEAAGVRSLSPDASPTPGCFQGQFWILCS